MKVIKYAAAAAVLVLAGCGSGESGSGSSGEAGGPKKSTPAVDCSDESLSQADWVEHCMGTEDVPKEGENPLEPVTVKAGKAHTLTTEEGDQLSYSFSGVDCDPGKITEYDEQADVVTADPKSGHQFCVVRGTVKNVGKKPVEWGPEADGALLADGSLFARGEQQPLGDDGARTGDQIGLNPRSTYQITDVYEVPKGQTPTAIQFTDADFTEIRFELTTK